MMEEAHAESEGGRTGPPAPHSTRGGPAQQPFDYVRPRYLCGGHRIGYPLYPVKLNPIHCVRTLAMHLPAHLLQDEAQEYTSRV